MVWSRSRPRPPVRCSYSFWATKVQSKTLVRRISTIETRRLLQVLVVFDSKTRLISFVWALTVGLDIRAFLDVLVDSDWDGESDFLSGVWPLTSRNLDDVTEVGMGVEWDWRDVFRSKIQFYQPGSLLFYALEYIPVLDELSVGSSIFFASSDSSPLTTLSYISGDSHSPFAASSFNETHRHISSTQSK